MESFISVFYGPPQGACTGLISVPSLLILLYDAAEVRMPLRTALGNDQVWAAIGA